MSYSVDWHPNVRKFLRKLPRDLSKRIVYKVKEIRSDPFHYLEHFEGKDYYKFRVGDYRLLIDVDIKNKILFVRVLGHRKNVYKNR